MTREEYAIISVVLLSLLVVCVLLLFRKPFTPVQWLLYLVNLLLVRVLWRADLSGNLLLPECQGAVIICNHCSSIDPCIIQVAARHRLVHWMVARLYSQHSLVGWLLQKFQVIPVGRRGTDVSPAKAAIRLAAAGELVGMLPEGSINTTDQFMLPVRPGAVLVALKARVPIVPCYIEGSPYHKVHWRPVLMPARVRLKVGRAIDLSEYFNREREDGLVARLTIECVKEIARLAGRDDFQPQLAGKEWKTWQ